MAIYTGGMRMRGEAQAAAKRIAKQQAKAGKAERKRKGRAGIFGKIGGALMGAAAVGLTGLTGGLAAPLVMGVATSLGKKWADEASKGGSPFGKLLKSPGQVDKIKAGGKYGYGRGEAAEATKDLRESRKTDFSAETMLGDIASSYLSAGLSGGLSGGAKQLMSGEKGSIAKAFGGAEGAKGLFTDEGLSLASGWEGVKQSFGYELEGLGEGGKGEFSVPEIAQDYDASKVDLPLTQEELDHSQLFEGSYESVESINPELDEEGWSITGEHGGRVPQMDQHTLLGLAILSEMANQKKAHDDTPLEEVGQSTIADMFASQGKTLGGNNTQSLSQMLGR